MQAKAISTIICFLSIPCSAETSTYRHRFIKKVNSTITSIFSVEETAIPRWARDVAIETYSGSAPREEVVFTNPVSFVIPPYDPDEPFHLHNHQPSDTWFENGDLMVNWYTTNDEAGTELTVLASRLRRGAKSGIDRPRFSRHQTETSRSTMQTTPKPPTNFFSLKLPSPPRSESKSPSAALSVLD